MISQTQDCQAQYTSALPASEPTEVTSTVSAPGRARSKRRGSGRLGAPSRSELDSERHPSWPSARGAGGHTESNFRVARGGRPPIRMDFRATACRASSWCARARDTVRDSERRRQPGFEAGRRPRRQTRTSRIPADLGRAKAAVVSPLPARMRVGCRGPRPTRCRVGIPGARLRRESAAAARRIRVGPESEPGAA